MNINNLDMACLPISVSVSVTVYHLSGNLLHIIFAIKVCTGVLCAGGGGGGDGGGEVGGNGGVGGGLVTILICEVVGAEQGPVE